MSCFKTITISSFYPISPDFEIASFLTRSSVPERRAAPKTRDRTGFFTNPAKMYVAAETAATVMAYGCGVESVECAAYYDSDEEGKFKKCEF